MPCLLHLLALAGFVAAIPFPNINPTANIQSPPSFYDITSIDLDLLDHSPNLLHEQELQQQQQQQQQQQLIASITNSSTNPSFTHYQTINTVIIHDDDKEEDINSPSRSKGVDLTQVKKFQLSRRDSLDAAKMQYAVRDGPSVIEFKDTHTVLVPDDEILLGGIKDKSRIRYTEYDLSDCKSGFEEDLIAATGCLIFPSGKGGGKVQQSHAVSVSMTPQGTGSVTLSMPVVIGLSLRFKVGLSASYSTSYACSAKEGDAVRLFYQIGTVEVGGRKRSFVYDSLKKVLMKAHWVDLKQEKYLTDSLPMFYCGNESKMNLRCECKTSSFRDKSGNVFTSKLQS